MNKYMINYMVLLGFGLTSFAQTSYLDQFPARCAEASDSQAMPGHILRLGFIARTTQGLLFFFPDQRNSDVLQSVDILENVGLIGQNPYDDFSEMIWRATPSNDFVVGQIFIGDPGSEPVVTCVSSVTPIRRYVPSYYGDSYNWLDRTAFQRWFGKDRYTWLERRKYSRWQWRKWDRDFGEVRRKFDRYWSQRSNKDRYKSSRGNRGEGRRKDKIGTGRGDTGKRPGRGGGYAQPTKPTKIPGERRGIATGKKDATARDNITRGKTRAPRTPAMGKNKARRDATITREDAAKERATNTRVRD